MKPFVWRHSRCHCCPDLQNGGFPTRRNVTFLDLAVWPVFQDIQNHVLLCNKNYFQHCVSTSLYGYAQGVEGIDEVHVQRSLTMHYYLTRLNSVFYENAGQNTLLTS